MNRFFAFFKNASPVILALISVVVGIIAKLIEKYSANIAMGLQLITFILFFYALVKLFDRKKK